MEDVLRQQLLKLSENKKGWGSIIRSRQNKYLLDALDSEYPHLTSLPEKMYWLKNNLTEYPKCPTCGKSIIRFDSNHYPKHCSPTCTQLDKAVRDKYAASCMERYGVSNSGKSQELRKKQKETLMSRYGVDNIFKDKDYIKKCNLDKLGVTNCAKLSQTIEKRKTTLQDRYGVNSGFELAPKINKSKGELELFEYIKLHYSSAISGDRNVIAPLELDIFIPEINVGIEYDGDYWHSLPDMIERDQRKDAICKDKGIRLIRIKESDWLNNLNMKNKLLEEIENI